MSDKMNFTTNTIARDKEGYCLLISGTIQEEETTFINMYIHSTFVVLLFSYKVMFNSSAASWTIAHQAPLSMGLLRLEYWNRLPGYLPDPGIKPTSAAWQTDSLLMSHQGSLHSTQNQLNT